MEYIAKSLADTEKLAKKFAKSLHGGERILLNGDLGTGKTTFTKYLAKALGVKDDVTSPTFTILKSYQGKKYTLNHFDMYRLSGGTEATGFGFEDYLYDLDDNSIVIIEWSEMVKDILSGDFIIINITRLSDTERKFEIIEG